MQVSPPESALNSPQVWLAAIGVIGTFLAGLVQIVILLINRSERNIQHAATTAQNSILSSQVETVRQEVDGKISRLLKVDGDSREAEGNLAGHAEEKANPS